MATKTHRILSEVVRRCRTGRTGLHNQNRPIARLDNERTTERGLILFTGRSEVRQTRRPFLVVSLRSRNTTISTTKIGAGDQ